MKTNAAALALASASALLPSVAKAEAPPAPERAPLTWQQHQEWKPAPIVVPAPAAVEAQAAPEFSAVGGTALDLVPTPSPKPPVSAGGQLLEPPPVIAPEVKPVAKPAKIAAAPQKLRLPPSTISQSGIEVRRTDNVLPFERLEPATREDIFINPGNTPEIRHTDESATINLRLSAKRPLELEVKVISGAGFLGTPGIQQIAVGRDTNIRATVGKGPVVLGLFDAAGKEIDRVEYKIHKERSLQHSVSFSANQNENLNPESDTDTRYNYSANYNLSPRDGNWNASVRGSWSPEANRSVGFSWSYRFR